MSTAEIGGIIWIDRDYRFSNLPSYLVGSLLFKVPCKSIHKGTVTKITVHNPSTIYIAHQAVEDHIDRSGGFENSLPNSGWTLVNDNIVLFSGGNIGHWIIWKKDVSANGRTTVPLPATTTDETVHSIFVKGNSQKNYLGL